MSTIDRVSTCDAAWQAYVKKQKLDSPTEEQKSAFTSSCTGQAIDEASNDYTDTRCFTEQASHGWKEKEQKDAGSIAKCLADLGAKKKWAVPTVQNPSEKADPTSSTDEAAEIREYCEELTKREAKTHSSLNTTVYTETCIEKAKFYCPNGFDSTLHPTKEDRRAALLGDGVKKGCLDANRAAVLMNTNAKLAASGEAREPLSPAVDEEVRGLCKLFTERTVKALKSVSKTKDPALLQQACEERAPELCKDVLDKDLTPDSEVRKGYMLGDASSPGCLTENLPLIDERYDQLAAAKPAPPTTGDGERVTPTTTSAPIGLTGEVGVGVSGMNANFSNNGDSVLGYDPGAYFTMGVGVTFPLAKWLRVAAELAVDIKQFDAESGRRFKSSFLDWGIGPKATAQFLYKMSDAVTFVGTASFALLFGSLENMGDIDVDVPPTNTQYVLYEATENRFVIEPQVALGFEAEFRRLFSDAEDVFPFLALRGQVNIPVHEADMSGLPAGHDPVTVHFGTAYVAGIFAAGVRYNDIVALFK